LIQLGGLLSANAWVALLTQNVNSSTMVGATLPSVPKAFDCQRSYFTVIPYLVLHRVRILWCSSPGGIRVLL
jgi:hypothetical protein